MSFANRQASHDGREGLIAAEPPGSQATLNAQRSLMNGGAVRNDLSTALVRLYREVFGRGPVRTTTYAFDAGYVTFLRDVLLPHERRLVLSGRADLVCETRIAIREAERERLIAEVRRRTGRPVLHDSFQFQPERDQAIELFWAPKPFADEPGTTPAPQAIRTNRSPEQGVVSDGTTVTCPLNRQRAGHNEQARPGSQ
jgi:uncharacterized protein YbcI